jgi:peptidoglycan/LPS O-acetylase OafA/YrhL
MSDKSERRGYLTLDGLRAVGAFMVVMRHVPWLFGPLRVPESFLAVDLFYLVSGFVVAHAYRGRLEKGGYFREFVLVRLIRLYPLYAIAMLIGLVVAVACVLLDPEGWWTWQKIDIAVASGIVMFPMSPGMPAAGTALDGPTWTLLPELLANFAYAALVPRLNRLRLILLTAGFGAVLAAIQFHSRNLDIGYGPTEFWIALVRVGFSFSAGVLVRDLLDESRFKVSPVVSWGLLVVLAFILGVRPTGDARALFEIVVVLFAFPVLVALAASFEPDSRSGRLFSFTGLMSYGVYLLHQPIGNLLHLILTNVPVLEDIDVPDDLSILPWSVAFCVALVFFASWLDKVYDAPMRDIVRKALLPKKKA